MIIKKLKKSRKKMRKIKILAQKRTTRKKMMTKLRKLMKMKCSKMPL